jgi:hypothetical protein
MADTGNFEKYQARMADWAARTMSAKGKPLPDLADFSKDELELFDDVFRRFAEISETIDNLDLCLGFVSARTPRRKGLKLDAYLNYHIAFYLQEIYILKERLKSYATRIMRLKKRRGLPVSKTMYTTAIEMVEKSLSNIVTVRGSHVHDRPFADDEMRMLGAYSFLAVQVPEDPNWLRYARVEYAGVKTTWVKRIRTNKIELKRLLDTFFEFLYHEVDGTWLVPPNNSFKVTPDGAPQFNS